MNLKYYLRGLGIGIVVTAAILSLSHKAEMKKAVMTDEEIITEAKKLGMIMGPVKEPTPESPVPSEIPKESTSPSGKEDLENPKSEPESTDEPESGIEPSKAPPMEDTGDLDGKAKETFVEITISKGMWSDVIAQLIEDAGLVEDAKDFNEFLSDNGYASYISVGTYEIEMGADYSEIAKIITRQE